MRLASSITTYLIVSEVCVAVLVQLNVDKEMNCSNIKLLE